MPAIIKTGTACRDRRVIYSGIYGICKRPSGKACVKAIFPLLKGNAPVILNPKVGAKGELILDASGKRFGDAGFYFLLNDAKGNYWAQFICSFRDRLIIRPEGDIVLARQTLTPWHLRVLTFLYRIQAAGMP